MDQATHNKVVSFIWGIADDVLREGGTTRKGLPEKKRKKLLDHRTWERNGHLVETASSLREELGDKLYEDHNVFRDLLDDALKKLELKVSASDRKLILRAVSWRVETAAPVIAKIHKVGKAKADPLKEGRA